MKKNFVLCVFLAGVVGVTGLAFQNKKVITQTMNQFATRNIQAIQAQEEMMEKAIQVNKQLVEEATKKEEFYITNFYPKSVQDENGGWYVDEGSIITEYNNGSWSLVNEEKGLYIFQPVELGDWDYQVDTLEQLEMIIATYKSMKETGRF